MGEWKNVTGEWKIVTGEWKNVTGEDFIQPDLTSDNTLTVHVHCSTDGNDKVDHVLRNSSFFGTFHSQWNCNRRGGGS